MMDEETISRMQTPPLPVRIPYSFNTVINYIHKNHKDISYEVETRAPLSTLPPDEGPKLMDESKKLSMREEIKVMVREKPNPTPCTVVIWGREDCTFDPRTKHKTGYV